MNRRQPAASVEYSNHQPFNATRQAPAKASGTVPVASQAAPIEKKASAPTPERKQTGEAFWGQFAGQELIFQLKSGAIVQGKFEGLQRNWLKVVNAVITGKANKATVPWVSLETNSLAHFHPPGQVEGIGARKE